MMSTKSKSGFPFVSGLFEERDRLSDRKDQLTKQSRQLAFQHYPTFILAADTCRDIAKEFKATQTHLKDAVESIPKVAKRCSLLRNRLQEVSLHRKRTSLVLAKHPKLLEVLELPQLMETCVKNNHHEEALAIQQLCAKLYKPLGNVSLVANVLDEVHNSSLWMLNQLLSRLKTTIQLPECLKVIGFIRRMGAFNETQLRLKFLQARESYFQSVIPLTCPSGTDPYSHLCRVIEQTRICVFDTLTQYRALFSDEDPFFSSGTPTNMYRQIFSSWLFQKLSAFVSVIQVHLTTYNMEEQSVDSLLGQAMYFGQSLGRVGFDFRLLLIPVFVKIMVQRSLAILSEEEIKIGEEKSDDLTLPLGEGDVLNFYSLAECCNNVIQASNQLRYAPPISILPTFVSELQHFVDGVQESIDEAKRRVDADRIQNIELQFKTRVIPFCNLCLGLIFNEADTAQLDKFQISTQLEGKSVYLEAEEIRIEAEEKPEAESDEKPEAEVEEKPEAEQEEEPEQEKEVSDSVETDMEAEEKVASS